MSPKGTRQATQRQKFTPGLEKLESREVPAVISQPDYYRVNEGQSVTIPASRGVLANDFSSTNAGAVLTARIIGQPFIGAFTATGNGGNVLVLANPLPANTVTLNPDGSLQIIMPSNLPVTANQITFTYLASNALDATEIPDTATVTIFVGQNVGSRYAVGTQAGTPAVVHVYDSATNQLLQTFTPYESTFTGGVRVAVADFTGDGYPDVATAPGVGGSPRIKIYDGRTGRVIFDQFVFTDASGFTGGAYVAAGDVNGDSFPDLIVGAGVGGGPRVNVINGQGLVPVQPAIGDPFNSGNQIDLVSQTIARFNLLMDFFAYEPEFRGGVKVAAGDVQGVGRDFVITAPGVGGGPVVKTFDFNEVVGQPNILVSGIAVRQPRDQFGLNALGSAQPAVSFLAGDESGRVGVNISTADINADGKAEIVTGTAAGPAVVSLYSGVTGGLLSQFGIPFEANAVVTGRNNGSLITGNAGASGVLLGGNTPPNSLVPSQNRSSAIGGSNSSAIVSNVPPLAGGGVTVFGFDVNGDGIDEIVTGSGRGNSPRVRIFKADGTQVDEYLAFAGNLFTGINVG